MSTTLLLVRHASHAVVATTLVGRMPGVGLSPDGQREADELAAAMAHRLAGMADALLTSPRQRCVETAALLGARLRLVPAEDEALDELDTGAWTGQRFEALRADPDWCRWNAARSLASAPGGEGALALQARAAGFAARVATQRPGATVVAVSHAEPIRMVVLAALGMGPDAWARIDLDPASLTTIRLASDGRAVLAGLNERPWR